MAEYIKKNDLIKHIERSFGEISTPFVVKEIKDFPNADVVEVVRCKDCKHYTNIDTYRNPPRLDFHWCNKLGNITKEKDYCSYGERRCEE